MRVNIARTPIPSGFWGRFVGQWTHNKTAPRRCVNTVDPRGLADWIGVD